MILSGGAHDGARALTNHTCKGARGARLIPPSMTLMLKSAARAYDAYAGAGQRRQVVRGACAGVGSAAVRQRRGSAARSAPPLLLGGRAQVGWRACLQAWNRWAASRPSANTWGTTNNGLGWAGHACYGSVVVVWGLHIWLHRVGKQPGGAQEARRRARERSAAPHSVRPARPRVAAGPEDDARCQAAACWRAQRWRSLLAAAARQQIKVLFIKR